MGGGEKHQKEEFDVKIENEMKNIKTLETMNGRTMKEKSIIMSSGQFDSIEELDLRIEENMERHVGRQWRCKLCQRICRDKTNVKEHVEIHFDGLSFPCNSCDKTFRSRLSIRKHMMNHKN